MNHNVRFVASPSPLSVDRGRIDRMVPEGLTVSGHLRTVGLNPDPLWARVFIDGRLIPKAEWEWTVPKAHQCLTVRAIPMGGDGGGGKMAVRIVAMLAVVVASVYTGGAAASALGPGGSGLFGVGGLSAGTAGAIGAGISAGITIASTLAINGHIPPPLPRLSQHQETA